MLNIKENTIKSAVLKQIDESPDNAIFFLGDFAEFGSVETIRKIFVQARIQGFVKQLAHGIYIKPLQSKFGEVPPSLDDIAIAIAARDCVEIMPTGSTATNLLGLSTQVPMVVSYLTTGSSRNIRIGNRVIKFKHAAPKNFAFKGKTMPLIVQALRELGKENIDDNILSALSLYLAKAPDKEYFNSDILWAPAWIQSIVKPLLRK
jgi:hypothetical protein